jgi:hypothetical protein
MAGTVRIEKCGTNDIAERRRDNLVARGFDAMVVSETAYLTLSDISVGPDGAPMPHDAVTPIHASWLVIAIRDH